MTRGSKSRPDGDYRAFDWMRNAYTYNYKAAENWANRPGNYIRYDKDTSRALDNTRDVVGTAVQLGGGLAIPKMVSRAAVKYALPKFFANPSNVSRLLNWDEAVNIPGMVINGLVDYYSK
jgi:hypothetical protein